MTRSQDTSRTLRITPRAAALTLSSGQGPLRAEWRGPAPRVRDRGGVTEIGYGLLGRVRMLVTRRSSLALKLAPRIPLDLEIAGGVSGLRADLRELDIRSLTISGGANDVLMDLPAPAHELPVRIEGGASRTVVRRPTQAPVSVEIDGGASGLRIDEERLGAIGGHVTRHAGAGAASVRLRVLGGAAGLSVAAAP